MIRSRISVSVTPEATGDFVAPNSVNVFKEFDSQIKVTDQVLEFTTSEKTVILPSGLLMVIFESMTQPAALYMKNKDNNVSMIYMYADDPVVLSDISDLKISAVSVGSPGTIFIRAIYQE